MIIEHKEDISSNFDGTIIDIETIGEFSNNKLYKIYNDSRQCENILQVIFGFINKKGPHIFCAKGKAAINDLEILTEQILGRLERPFYAFNADFESSVWFHQLGKKIIFDRELNKEKYEKKSDAVKSLGIPNYGDPFYDNGRLCMEAWEKGDFDKAMAHNRACLLKERDILLKRRCRTPNELNFNK